MTVETTCAEQPLLARYRGGEADRKERIDGRFEKWDDFVEVTDDTDDLHPTMSALDIKGTRHKNLQSCTSRR